MLTSKQQSKEKASLKESNTESKSESNKRNKSSPKVTLVGKGVCFDTGGLDIKTHEGMLEMKKDMGGLRKFMPVTFTTWVVSTLALCGVFPFSGFFSKDEILWYAMASTRGGSFVLLGVAAFTVVVGLLVHSALVASRSIEPGVQERIDTAVAAASKRRFVGPTHSRPSSRRFAASGARTGPRFE